LRNATLEILWDTLNERRKKMEGLKGRFHQSIFDVAIVDVEILDVPITEGRCESAEKKNSEQDAGARKPIGNWVDHCCQSADGN